MQKREYTHNAAVVYVDSSGHSHTSLVTAWWGVAEVGHEGEATYGSKPHPQFADEPPGCNLVYLSGDVTKRDPYGRQLERATSVVHKSKQAAPANYWCWPDEL